MSVILCTAGYDHTIRFWEALSGICSRTIQHPDSQVNRLCISPDKRYLAAAGHHTIKLFDIKSTNPNPLLTFEGHTGNVTGVAFHCEGKWMVTSSEDGTVKIWETRTGNIQRSYNHGSAVRSSVATDRGVSGYGTWRRISARTSLYRRRTCRVPALLSRVMGACCALRTIT
jgi:target of rapamycin complex subunit LST8